MTGVDDVNTRCTVVSLERARSLIANTMLATRGEVSGHHTIGRITLLPHQYDAVLRLRATIAEFHGALLADEVGLGKTFVALAMAAAYPRSHVIAPASLIPMWQRAIVQSELHSLVVHSLQACSLRAPAIPAPDECRCLVVIDEAHHVRNRGARRYRTIADAVGGHDVLLVSATPVHNRPRDLRAQLRLFAGDRSDLLEPSMLSRLIVRRTTAMFRAAPAERRAARAVHRSSAGFGIDRIPHVVQHPALAVPHDDGVLSAILAMPAPLPARDGAVAGALVRIGLLRAWCSSDAALEAVVARRILRASALRDALLDGRHPTRAELRSWIVGDHEVQLAFPLLVTGHGGTTDDSAALVATLDVHVAALAALRKRHGASACGDLARAQHLRDLLDAHPGVPIVAFSQFADTVRALHRALSRIAGVGMLTATSARIASGNVARNDLLARFAPHAQGVPPPAPHDTVRLLLSTDMLAEGVNLQDAGVVVHLDLPWTDALRQQRVGRVARLGSGHGEVQVYCVQSPPGAERALRQLERLQAKAAFGETYVGGVSTRASAADDASAIRAVLQSWQREVYGAVAESQEPAVAFARGSRFAALLLVEHGILPVLLACGLGPSGVTRGAAASDRVSDVRALLESIGERVDDVATPECALRHRIVAVLERAAGDWVATRAARDDAGIRSEALSSAQRALVSRIQLIVASSSPMKRHALFATARDALVAAYHARGEAAERALEQWLSSFAAEKSAQWLLGWSEFPLLRSSVARSRGMADADSSNESSGGQNASDRNASHQNAADDLRLRVAVVLLPDDVD